jgi:hypothetical protein
MALLLSGGDPMQVLEEASGERERETDVVESAPRDRPDEGDADERTPEEAGYGYGV